MGLSGARAYTNINATSGVENADPHMLIQMLIDGAIEKTNMAKYFMQKKELAKKGQHVSWAISIIGGLRSSLDMKKGGEISKNLDDLYEYCVTTLMEANSKNDLAKLDNVLQVMKTIKEGWDGIRQETLQQAS
ncbi:MAG: flagellar export chaperone FliS [Kangiella sp.]|nr:MAG: flagellar export chaperone FliS [Kangiella sp.]